jgi:hypothetical protein
MRNLKEANGIEAIHTLTRFKASASAMNISADIPPRREGSNSVILQSYEEATSRAGGILIIDHPNYQWALTTKDIQPLKNVFLFEVYNAANKKCSRPAY